MSLTNKHGKKIAKEVKFCKTSLQKSIGLMFSPNISDRCLVFVFDEESIPSFHMLFVFFPIDMAFLSRQKKIVDLREGAKPFTPLIQPKHKCSYVLELPAGTIKKHRLKIGDQLRF